MTRAAPRLWVMLLCAGLGACAADVGDLGRARPSVWHSDIYPYAGAQFAWLRGEQVSGFHLTDDEIELRDRSWRYIMPAHEQSWFHKNVQELARTRIIPVAWQTTEPDRYGVALVHAPFRSEQSRYRRLSEDAVADAALIAPYCRIAQKVVAADKVRLKTATASPSVLPLMLAHADARVSENEGMIAWVRERMTYRLQTYRHALDNLVVQMPSREAIMAERAVLSLERDLRICAGLVVQSYQLGPPLVSKH
ncbi:MAG: hypothetical protein ACRCUE_10295 [Bosea sp. (in: a-proteobacteria)]